MNLTERIYHNQTQALSIEIGIDKMPVKNTLKQRVLDALMNQEDFALVNESGAYAYFLVEGFMCYVNGENSSVTHLATKKAWQNAVKVTMLGHTKFVSQKVLLLNANYVYLKDGLKQEQVKLIAV